MKLIAGLSGFFISMPSRKRPDGSHQDIAHPITAEMRRILEEAVLQAYQDELKNHPPQPPRGNAARPPQTGNFFKEGENRPV